MEENLPQPTLESTQSDFLKIERLTFGGLSIGETFNINIFSLKVSSF